MEKGHLKYTIEQLLDDENFIAAIKHPNPERNAHWKNMIRNGSISQEQFDFARDFILEVQPKDTLHTNEITSLWENIQRQNSLKKKKKDYRLYLYPLVAVCITLGIVFGFYSLFRSNNDQWEEQLAELVKEEIITETSQTIQLILADNSIIPLNGQNTTIAYNQEGSILVNSQPLIHKNKKGIAAEEHIELNQLIVPAGKKSSLILPDGSQLYINAGTRVIYPTVFNEKERYIYVEGEAYLDVFHNDEQPFIVKTKKMDVQVLGTSFNVKAYKDEDEEFVVLVSGSVKIKAAGKKPVLMEPNHLFFCNSSKSGLREVDVSNYILWKDNILKFESEAVNMILNQLSRYYGIEIIYPAALSEIKCSGKLDLKDNIQKVLEGLSKVAPISYKEENGKYYISINRKK